VELGVLCEWASNLEKPCRDGLDAGHESSLVGAYSGRNPFGDRYHCGLASPSPIAAVIGCAIHCLLRKNRVE